MHTTLEAALDAMPVCSTQRAPAASLARLLAAPRFALGRWPTPVHAIDLRDGPRILVKRDDLSSWGRGGAKARKIEHLVGHLRAHGYDELVTVAGNVTNLAFDLLPALDRAGIGASLFIIDDPHALPEDRELVFEGIRRRVTLLGPSRIEVARALARRWLQARREGKKPFLALPGVSHPAGVLGNAHGFVEMAMQRMSAGAPMPRTVFVTAATGTTVAGFLLAEHALREAGCAPIRVVGVQAYPGAMRRSVRWLLRWTERHLGWKTRVPDARIEIVDSELCGGFGSFSRALGEECERVLDETGLCVDPIFGGKTWAAMDRARVTSRADDAVLYWHCGYTPEWKMLGTIVERGIA